MFFLLLLFFPYSLFSLEAIFNTKKIEVGEPFRLEININDSETPFFSSYQAQLEKQMSDLGIAIQKKDIGEKIVIYDLQAYSVGNKLLYIQTPLPYALAPLKVDAKPFDYLNLLSSPLSFFSLTSTQKQHAENKEKSKKLLHKESKELFQSLSLQRKWALYIFIGLVLCILLWALRLLLKHFRFVEKVSPIESIKERLKSLENRLVDKQIDHEAFTVELTLLLRQYIELVFAIPALEMTSIEFFEKLFKNGDIPEQQVRVLKEILSGADLIKFAKKGINENECFSLLKDTKTFIINNLEK